MSDSSFELRTPSPLLRSLPDFSFETANQHETTPTVFTTFAPEANETSGPEIESAGANSGSADEWSDVSEDEIFDLGSDDDDGDWYGRRRDRLNRCLAFESRKIMRAFERNLEYYRHIYEDEETFNVCANGLVGLYQRYLDRLHRIYVLEFEMLEYDRIRMEESIEQGSSESLGLGSEPS